MDAGISTTSLRVAGKPIGNDEWVQQFVPEKATAVQGDVSKLEMISDGLSFYQMLRFCQNTRLAFLGRNVPTLCISDILAQVDATILEALCRNGKTNMHAEYTAVFRRYSDIKLPHFRKGFGVTSNAGSAISAFYGHLCLSCNGSIFAVILSRISLILPAHGPRAKIWTIWIYGLPLF